MAGGFPSGEDFGLFLVNAAEDGVEGLDGGGAGADGFGDAGGGSGAFAKGGSLLARAAFQFGGHFLEISSGICAVAVSLKLVIGGELADSGGEGAGLGDEAGVAVSIRHSEALHEGGVSGFRSNGGGGKLAGAEECLSFVLLAAVHGDFRGAG